jgi:hypothetical protein
VKRLLWTIPLLAALLLGLAVFLSGRRSAPGARPAGPETTEHAPRTSLPPGATDVPAKDPARAPQEPTGLSVVVRAQGLGLEGVTVEVLRLAVHEYRRFKTPRGGRQSLHGMPPGDYRIHVDHSPYLPAVVPARVEAGKVSEVVVDLRESGQIFGRVRDTAGAALPGTQVAVLDPQTGGPGINDPSTQTDASGHYRLARVGPGRYIVRFRHPHYRALQTEATLSVEGEKCEVNAILEPGRRISGRVLDESGAPVAGAIVTASNGEHGAATTDADGRFMIGGLGDQPIYCLASAPGYAATLRRDVAPGTSDLEIRLPRAGKISGRLDVAPLPRQFTLRLLHLDEETRGYYPKRTVMFGDDGEFSLENLPPGTYKLEVEASGYRALDVPELTLRAGEKLEDVRIRLVRGR